MAKNHNGWNFGSFNAVDFPFSTTSISQSTMPFTLFNLKLTVKMMLEGRSVFIIAQTSGTWFESHEPKIKL